MLCAYALQVRAFKPWPSAKQRFLLEPIERDSEAASEGTSEPESEEITIKVLKTVIGREEDWQGTDDRDVTVTKDALHVKCGNGTVLSILLLQLPGRKPVTPNAFINGYLQNRTLHKAPEDMLGSK